MNLLKRVRHVLGEDSAPDSARNWPAGLLAAAVAGVLWIGLAGIVPSGSGSALADDRTEQERERAAESDDDRPRPERPREEARPSRRPADPNGEAGERDVRAREERERGELEEREERERDELEKRERQRGQIGPEARERLAREREKIGREARERLAREREIRVQELRERELRDGRPSADGGDRGREPRRDFRPETDREAALYEMIVQLRNEIAALRRDLEATRSERGGRLPPAARDGEGPPMRRFRDGDGPPPGGPRGFGGPPPRGFRDGEGPPRLGPRDGEGPPRRGPRDGEGPAVRGPRDGEGPPRRGPRDGEGPAVRGPRDGEGQPPAGPRDGDRRPNAEAVRDSSAAESFLNNSSVAPQDAKSPTREGVITQIDRSGRFLQISLGEQDGLQRGQVVHIWRTQPTPAYIGNAKVFTTQAKTAVAQPIRLTGSMQVSDRVGSRTPLTADPSSPASLPPAERGENP